MTLVDAFSTVFVEQVPQNAADHQVCVGVLDDVDLSLWVIAGLLSCLNSSSTAGSGSLHLHMLKAYSDALSLPLYLLLVRSLSEGEFPTLWKTSIVTPLFRSGNLCDPLNYRPVSLTSVCCKVLEGYCGTACRILRIEYFVVCQSVWISQGQEC